MPCPCAWYTVHNLFPLFSQSSQFVPYGVFTGKALVNKMCYLTVKVFYNSLYWLFFFFNLMMPKKSPVSHTIPTRLIPDLPYTKKYLTESIGVVLAKDPPKVKLEESSNNIWEYELYRNCAYLIFWGSLGFYSSIELTSVSCVARCFLMEKIIINGRILGDPPYVRILFVLGLYRLGLIVRRKLFPFRIPWRSLKPGGCHMSIMCPSLSSSSA